MSKYDTSATGAPNKAISTDSKKLPIGSFD